MSYTQLEAKAEAFVSEVLSLLDGTFKGEPSSAFVMFAVSSPIRKRFRNLPQNLLQRVRACALQLDQRLSASELFHCVAVLAALDVALTAKDNHGRTVVHYAAHSGDIVAFDFLRRLTVDFAALDNFRRSAVHLAAFGGHVELLRRMQDMSIISTADRRGRTPLHLAALQGHTDCVELLVSVGMDPSTRDSDGRTPADLAARKGHMSCVRSLSVPSSVPAMEVTVDWYLFDAIEQNDAFKAAFISPRRAAAGQGGSATVHATLVGQTWYALRVDLTPPPTPTSLPLHIQHLVSVCHRMTEEQRDKLKSRVLDERLRTLILPLAGRWAWWSPTGQLLYDKPADNITTTKVWVEVAYFVADTDTQNCVELSTLLLAASNWRVNISEVLGIHAAIEATHREMMESLLGLAHGDLKPSNIFIAFGDFGPRALFIDFTSLCRHDEVPLMTTRGYYSALGETSAKNDDYAIKVMKAELILHAAQHSTVDASKDDALRKVVNEWLLSKKGTPTTEPQQRRRNASSMFREFCAVDSAVVPPRPTEREVDCAITEIVPTVNDPLLRLLNRAQAVPLKGSSNPEDLLFLIDIHPTLYTMAVQLFDPETSEDGKNRLLSLFLSLVDDLARYEQATTRLGLSIIQRAECDEDKLIELYLRHGLKCLDGAAAEAQDDETHDVLSQEIEPTSAPSLSFSAVFPLCPTEIDTIISFSLATAEQPTSHRFEVASQCVQLVARRKVELGLSSQEWMALLPTFFSELNQDHAGVWSRTDEPLNDLKGTHVVAQYVASEFPVVRFGRVRAADVDYVWLQDDVASPGDLRYFPQQSKSSSAPPFANTWKVDYPVFARFLPPPRLRRVPRAECIFWKRSLRLNEEAERLPASIAMELVTNGCLELLRNIHAVYPPAASLGWSDDTFLDFLRRAKHLESFSAASIEFSFLCRCVAALCDKPFMNSLRVSVKSAHLDPATVLNVFFLCRRQLQWYHVMISCEHVTFDSQLSVERLWSSRSFDTSADTLSVRARRLVALAAIEVKRDDRVSQLSKALRSSALVAQKILGANGGDSKALIQTIVGSLDSEPLSVAEAVSVLLQLCPTALPQLQTIISDPQWEKTVAVAASIVDASNGSDLCEALNANATANKDKDEFGAFLEMVTDWLGRIDDGIKTEFQRENCGIGHTKTKNFAKLVEPEQVLSNKVVTQFKNGERCKLMYVVVGSEQECGTGTVVWDGESSDAAWLYTCFHNVARHKGSVQHKKEIVVFYGKQTATPEPPLPRFCMPCIRSDGTAREIVALPYQDFFKIRLDREEINLLCKDGASQCYQIALWSNVLSSMPRDQYHTRFAVGYPRCAFKAYIIFSKVNSEADVKRQAAFLPRRSYYTKCHRKNAGLSDKGFSGSMLLDLVKQRLTNPKYLLATGGIIISRGQNSADPHYPWFFSVEIAIAEAVAEKTKSAQRTINDTKLHANRMANETWVMTADVTNAGNIVFAAADAGLTTRAREPTRRILKNAATNALKALSHATKASDMGLLALENSALAIFEVGGNQSAQADLLDTLKAAARTMRSAVKAVQTVRNAFEKLELSLGTHVHIAVTSLISASQWVGLAASRVTRIHEAEERAEESTKERVQPEPGVKELASKFADPKTKVPRRVKKRARKFADPKTKGPPGVKELARKFADPKTKVLSAKMALEGGKALTVKASYSLESSLVPLMKAVRQHMESTVGNKTTASIDARNGLAT